MSKQNWFETLNAALQSENLIDCWPIGMNINYGQNLRIITDNELISIYRENNGLYERPIHYKLT